MVTGTIMASMATQVTMVAMTRKKRRRPMEVKATKPSHQAMIIRKMERVEVLSLRRLPHQASKAALRIMTKARRKAKEASKQKNLRIEIYSVKEMHWSTPRLLVLANQYQFYSSLFGISPVI